MLNVLRRDTGYKNKGDYVIFKAVKIILIDYFEGRGRVEYFLNRHAVQGV